jgi:hypothetical protein
VKRITLAVLLCLSTSALTQAQVYFSDFETDDGGFVGDNDWERGVPNGFMGDFSSTEPIGGHSGDFVWGTVIGGDHSPSTISTLAQTFDLTGRFNVQLSFWEWIDSGSNAFDTAEVIVNGNQEYLSDGFSNAAWRNVTLDLAAYDNQSAVDIAFVFTTTGVVERTGWYVDDVGLTAVPEPTGAGLLVVGLMALFQRRGRRSMRT